MFCSFEVSTFAFSLEKAWERREGTFDFSVARHERVRVAVGASVSAAPAVSELSHVKPESKVNVRWRGSASKLDVAKHGLNQLGGGQERSAALSEACVL